MAVEARHLNFSPAQLLNNSEMMNAIGGNANIYSTPIGYGVPPLSGTTTETLLHMYGSTINDSIPAKTPMKADSGLTYNLPVSRKRTRESINPLTSLPITQNQNLQNRSGSFTFLGEDISLQIQQQQFEIDHFIAQHTEKLRREIDERRKRNSRRIIAAVEEGVMKRLRAKEEEIEKIGKLNWSLEEKLKSLCIENQIWRDLAQTNEATAIALRCNLELVLAHVQDDDRHRTAAVDNGATAALMDDAQSCCGSNYEAESRGEIKGEMNSHNNDEGTSNSNSSSSNRWCRNCGKVESCVLLLPCRHLCLCTVCGSSLHTCPVCKSTKEASLHVNLSS